MYALTLNSGAEEATMIRFPEGFQWGVATAAHQIEGNNVNSDWWARENAADTDLAEPSGDAADSLHRHPDDIWLIASLGFNSYRFSIEWARIEPEPGRISRAMLQYYERLIDTCHQAGLVPIVTLHHFTHPRWFAREGGWRSSSAADRFLAYVRAVLPILVDVPFVCTINEANMLAGNGTDAERGMATTSLPAPDPLMTTHIIRAHRAARAVLSEIPGLRSGWSVANQAYHAVPGAEEAMIAWRRPREDVFLEVARDDDFLGVQAYLRTFIGPDGPVPVPAGVERTQMGWEYFPGALELAVRHAWQVAGGTPLLVTENGIATADDTRRIDYTTEALTGLHTAMGDGIDVLGYLHWSALDNYEWGSYAPTFGLIAWDPDTFERRPKPSATWLGEVARTSILH